MEHSPHALNVSRLFETEMPGGYFVGLPGLARVDTGRDAVHEMLLALRMPHVQATRLTGTRSVSESCPKFPASPVAFEFCNVQPIAGHPESIATEPGLRMPSQIFVETSQQLLCVVREDMVARRRV